MGLMKSSCGPRDFQMTFALILASFLIFYLWCLSLILITEKFIFIILYPVTKNRRREDLVMLSSLTLLKSEMLNAKWRNVLRICALFKQTDLTILVFLVSQNSPKDRFLLNLMCI